MDWVTFRTQSCNISMISEWCVLSDSLHWQELSGRNPAEQAEPQRSIYNQCREPRRTQGGESPSHRARYVKVQHSESQRFYWSHVQANVCLNNKSKDKKNGKLRRLSEFNFLVCGSADLPGLPRDLKVSDVTRGTCRLTWKPPECDGGERVKSYFIEKKTVEGKAWTKVQTHIWQLVSAYMHNDTYTLLNSATVAQSEVWLSSLFKVNPACAAQSLVVPDLINGQEYLFRIRAENRFGFGPFTETMEGTKARDPIRMFTRFDNFFCFLLVLAAAVHRYIWSQLASVVTGLFIYASL